MNLNRKTIVLALASALPWVSAQAQSLDSLKNEIETIRAKIEALQQKVENLNSRSGGAELQQQVNRLEQRQELTSDAQEESGFRGVKINGVIEVAAQYSSADEVNSFGASAGYAAGENAMIQISKETKEGEGVDWTLRLLPGSTSYLVHEASISVPVDKENRIIGGLMQDFQGYEYAFPNADPALGNQLITHNALYDLAGASFYTGLGMSHTFDNGNYALKWLIGNVDPANDDPTATFNDNLGNAISPASSSARSVALAYRGDWYVDSNTYIALSGLHGSVNRNFGIYALEIGYTHGDVQVNGQMSSGSMDHAATNGDTARWNGVSGLIGYRVAPRLQLLARADYLEDRANGGGTYNNNGGTYGYGLGAEKDSTGAIATDPGTGLATTGANLTRISLGTNYRINESTQWKAEYRLDHSSGYNFVGVDGITPRQEQWLFATSLMVSF